MYRLGLCEYSHSPRPFLAGLQPQQSKVRAMSCDMPERGSQWRTAGCRHGQWCLTGESRGQLLSEGHKGSFADTAADAMTRWSFSFTPSDQSLAVQHASATACSLLRGLGHKDESFQDIPKHRVATLYWHFLLCQLKVGKL